MCYNCFSGDTFHPFHRQQLLSWFFFLLYRTFELVDTKNFFFVCFNIKSNSYTLIKNNLLFWCQWRVEAFIYSWNHSPDRTTVDRSFFQPAKKVFYTQNLLKYYPEAVTFYTDTKHAIFDKKELLMEKFLFQGGPLANLSFFW